MAFSVPIPHLARTQAEPLLATVGNTPLLRLEKIPRDFPGVEIIRQTGGRLTHFVAAMGTSGTFTGITRRLKRDLPEVRCYSAQPSSGFHGLEGLKHMPTAIVPGIYDERLADGNLWIETEDAYRMVRRLAREEGLLVGISSGCNVHAATLLARELAARDESATIATVLCDSAEKYLSEHFWDE
jgi:cysteine synthase B